MVANIKTPIKIVPIILIFVFIISYSVFEARGIILGPRIIIESPQNGSGFVDSLVEIKGYVKNISYINLNDSPLAISEKGYFDEKFLLAPGYNIFRLEAKDRFGRKETKYLELFYKLEV